MAEELVLDVKTNIKSATVDTKEYKKSLEQVNEEINLQTRFIIDQEKELIKLKAKQDAIPKGAYYAGMSQLNDKIRETTAELKDEKQGLKLLKQEQKEATQENKKFTSTQKEGSKVSKDSIGNFRVMGVSLNGVKKGFKKVIPTAKAMFSTIKAGIMSTGIGALVLAVVALMQHFKRSEAGQEKFQRIMAAIGAVTAQVADAFANLGGIIIDTFQDPMPALKKFGNGLLKFLKDPTGATRDMFVKATIAAKDFVDETKKEVDALDEVTLARQKAHHIDRALKVERAKANREINDIRLQAEDRENQNATKRIALLRKAQAIEEDITKKEIESKKILIDAQQLEMAQGLNTIEAKDKLAQLQAELINLDTKKLRSQRLLQTQITTAVREEIAIKEQEAKDAQAIIDAEWDAKIEENDKWNEMQLAESELLLSLQQENSLSLIEDLKERALAELKIQEEKELASVEMMENAEEIKEQIRIKYARLRGEVVKKSAKDEMKWEDMTQDQKLNKVKNTSGEMSKILGEESAAGKAFAVTQATIDTYQGATAAYASMAKIPYVGPVLGAIAAGAAIVSGLANVKAILATGDGGGGGGGPSPAAAPPPAAAPQTPAPQMMSGAFELGGGEEVEPTRAYVVSDDITASQNGLEVIRRRATI